MRSLSLSFTPVLWAWESFSSNNNVLAFPTPPNNLACRCPAYRSCSGTVLSSQNKTPSEVKRSYMQIAQLSALPSWFLTVRRRMKSLELAQTGDCNLNSRSLTDHGLASFPEQMALEGDTGWAVSFKISQPVSFDSSSQDFLIIKAIEYMRLYWRKGGIFPISCQWLFWRYWVNILCLMWECFPSEAVRKETVNIWISFLLSFGGCFLRWAFDFNSLSWVENTTLTQLRSQVLHRSSGKIILVLDIAREEERSRSFHSIPFHSFTRSGLSLVCVIWSTQTYVFWR